MANKNYVTNAKQGDYLTWPAVVDFKNRSTNHSFILEEFDGTDFKIVFIGKILDMAYTKDFESQMLQFMSKTLDFMKETKEDIKDIKKDIKELKTDVAQLKQDVEDIKSCPTIKAELANLKK